METPLSRTLYYMRRYAKEGRRPLDNMQRPKPPPWVRKKPPADYNTVPPASYEAPVEGEWHTHTQQHAAASSNGEESQEHAGPTYHDPEEFARLCSELPFREAVETCTAALESSWLDWEHIPEILVRASRPKLYTRGYLQPESDEEEEEEEEIDTNKLFPGMLHPAVAKQARKLLVSSIQYTPSLDLKTTLGMIQLLVRLRWNDDAVAVALHVVKHTKLHFDQIMSIVKLPLKRCNVAEATRTVRMILFLKHAREEPLRREDLQALVALLVARGSTRHRQRIQQQRGKVPLARVNEKGDEEYKYGYHDTLTRIHAARDLIENYIKYYCPEKPDINALAPAFVTLVEGIIAFEWLEELDPTFRRMKELGVPLNRTIFNRLIETEGKMGRKDKVVKHLEKMFKLNIEPDSETLHSLCKAYIFKDARSDCTGLASYIQETSESLGVDVTAKVLGYCAFEAAKRKNWSETQQIKILADRLNGSEHTKQQWWYQKLVLMRAFEAVESE
eukprot:gb/GECG01000579.1/.p1 GENE.gb/GECG01000579.1/~~gb/GECG01000579.1/.p1  ORF type:complete len:503 (+),score=57.39 gb/GECG01000579.1/:1-1509(+)